MKWRRTDDKDLIASPPWFIRRCNGVYLLGRDTGQGTAECIGGFASADEAKQRAEESSSENCN